MVPPAFRFLGNGREQVACQQFGAAGRFGRRCGSLDWRFVRLAEERTDAIGGVSLSRVSARPEI